MKNLPERITLPTGKFEEITGIKTGKDYFSNTLVEKDGGVTCQGETIITHGIRKEKYYTDLYINIAKNI